MKSSGEAMGSAQSRFVHNGPRGKATHAQQLGNRRPGVVERGANTPRAVRARTDPGEY